jgi:hypothetical protein
MNDITGEHLLDRAFRTEVGNGMIEEIQLRQFATLSPTDIFISYAATFANGSPAKKALQNAQVDDPVSLVVRKNQILIETAEGLPIGQLSEAGKKTWRSRLNEIVSAKLIALVHRHSGEDPNPRAADDTMLHWEYPLIEVIWTASTQRATVTPEKPVLG